MIAWRVVIDLRAMPRVQTGIAPALLRRRCLLPRGEGVGIAAVGGSRETTPLLDEVTAWIGEPANPTSPGHRPSSSPPNTVRGSTLSIARTPEPPYYAVLFTNVRSSDSEGYVEMARDMVELASSQPGYLGMEIARGEVGILLSYWEDLASIAAWRAVSAHRTAQRIGRDRWFDAFKIRICRVERDYGFHRATARPG